jgi:hypothetical protein
LSESSNKTHSPQTRHRRYSAPHQLGPATVEDGRCAAPHTFSFLIAAGRMRLGGGTVQIFWRSQNTTRSQWREGRFVVTDYAISHSSPLPPLRASPHASIFSLSLSSCLSHSHPPYNHQGLPLLPDCI